MTIAPFGMSPDDSTRKVPLARRNLCILPRGGCYWMLGVLEDKQLTTQRSFLILFDPGTTASLKSGHLCLDRIVFDFLLLSVTITSEKSVQLFPSPVFLVQNRKNSI